MISLLFLYFCQAITIQQVQLVKMIKIEIDNSQSVVKSESKRFSLSFSHFFHSVFPCAPRSTIEMMCSIAEDDDEDEEEEKEATLSSTVETR